MDDVISRQQAIDALKRKQDDGKGDISRFYNTIIQHDIEAIMQLPPAEPQIVRCKDCKHLYKDGECPLRTWYTHVDDDFCSRAERRTE